MVLCLLQGGKLPPAVMMTSEFATIIHGRVTISAYVVAIVFPVTCLDTLTLTLVSCVVETAIYNQMLTVEVGVMYKTTIFEYHCRSCEGIRPKCHTDDVLLRKKV